MIPKGFFLLAEDLSTTELDTLMLVSRGEKENLPHHSVARCLLTECPALSNLQPVGFDPIIYKVSEEQPAKGDVCCFWCLGMRPEIGTVVEMDGQGLAIVDFGAIGCRSIRKYTYWMRVPMPNF